MITLLLTQAYCNLTGRVGRMKIDELKELLSYGGWFIGLGDQRPMGFGRFEVVSVKELNN